MKNIPNTEYMTINQEGIFVGGKPTKHYRDQELRGPAHIVERFNFLQSKYQNIKELHMMTSETVGEYCATGNPIAKHGSCSCAIMTHGPITPSTNSIFPHK